MSFDTKCWWRGGRSGRWRGSWGWRGSRSGSTWTQAVPRRKEAGPRRAAGLGRGRRPRMQALLAESVRWTGGKQRLTATRLHELLRGRGPRRRRDARQRRGRRVEAAAARGLRAADVSRRAISPRSTSSRCWSTSTGTRRKAWLFLMRLMYSGRDFAWIYERQDQISFLDGHVRAFAHFGGVPARIAYDNLRPAVVADPRRRRAHADAAVRGARLALPVRAVLLSARRRPRQGRRRGARQGHSAAGAGADSERADARGDQRGAARAARCARRDPRRAGSDDRSARASPRSSAGCGRRTCLRRRGDDVATVSPRALVRRRGRVLLGAVSLGRARSHRVHRRDDA